MSTDTFQRVPVGELIFGAKPTSTSFDWSQDYDDELGERRWEAWEYGTCEFCEQLTDTSGVCQNEECEYADQQVKTLEGPMMSSYWPFDPLTDFEPDEAAKLIVDLPLCIVQINEDEYGLALTGGGMDLSWEITEAFTRIGMLPPTDLRLPVMADKYWNERTEYIIGAMERAHRGALARLQHEMDELHHVEAQLREQTVN